MERYKYMAGSKGKMFVLQHCYKLLEHSEKWKIRDWEVPPARGALVKLNDEEEEDELDAKKNKKRPDGVKKEKDKLKKQAESLSIRDKMDDILKSRDHLVNKTLETKVMLMEKKSKRSRCVGSYSEKMRRSRPPSMRGEPEPKKRVPWQNSSPRRTR
jgi:hypothetical protein